MDLDPLPPTLDLAHLARQTLADRALERELLALFMEQCQRLLPELGGGGPRAHRAVAAHTLKGSALAVGAVRVGIVADALEIRFAQDETAEGPDARLLLELEAAIAEVGMAVARRGREAT